MVSEFIVSKSDKNKADMKSERVLLEFLSRIGITMVA